MPLWLLCFLCLFALTGRNISVMLFSHATILAIIFVYPYSQIPFMSVCLSLCAKQFHVPFEPSLVVVVVQHFVAAKNMRMDVLVVKKIPQG